MKRFLNWLKGILFGRCPKCKTIGTFKYRTDGSFVLDCSKCGYSEEGYAGWC